MLKVIGRVMQLAGKRKWRVISGFACGFLDGIFESFPLISVYLFLYRVMSDSLTNQAVAGITALLITGLAGRILCRYLVARLQSGTGFMMIADERLVLADKLRRAPMSFFDRNSQGDIATCVTSDIGYVELYVMFVLDKVVNGFLMTLVTGIFMLFFDIRVGVNGILGILPALLVFWLLSWTGKRLAPRRQQVQADLGAAVLEYAKGFPTLKSLGTVSQLAGWMRQTFTKSTQRSFELEWKTVPLAALLTVITKVTGCVVIVTAVSAALETRLTLPVTLLMIIAGFTLYAGLEQCAGLTGMLRLMEASLDRVEELRSNIELPISGGSGRQPQDSSIRFEHVDFSYDGTVDVLHDVSFEIPAGTSMALVGRSGCGKSTITKLISRFYSATRGTVLLGGADVAQMTEDEVFAHISIVFQDVYLFSDTIMENIRIARPGAARAEIEDACRKACCYEFIMALEKGFDTVLGEGGGTLSGGEKQRISIARAILKDAPVILLDEATSSVDPENEYLIQQAIGNLVKGKTLITIAHNLSAVREADQILVLEQGRIIQHGRHEELVAQPGNYHDMWKIYSEISQWKLGDA